MVTAIFSTDAQLEEGDTEEEQAENMADQLVNFARQCMNSRSKTTPFQCAFF